MSVLRPFSPVISVLQRFLDAALIASALFAVSETLEHERSVLIAMAAGAGAIVFVILGELQRLYGSWRLETMDNEFRSVMIGWGITCAALVTAAFLLKVSSSYSRLATIVWFLVTPALLIHSRLGVRLALGWLRRGGVNSRTVAIAGSGVLARAIVDKLEETGAYGVRVTGFYDDRSPDRMLKEGVDPARRMGSLADLIELARNGWIDYIFIALPLRAEKRIVELVNRLADTTASVYVVPDLFVFDLMRARWTMLGTLPAVSVYESPFDGLNGWLKRAEDLVLGTVFTIVSAIPMLVIGAAIKLTSGGPVLFKQRRYGLNGKLVEVLKFRTMTTADDGDHIEQASPGDARVTPFGRFLRATSLDELPQLFNVLRGDMSLVGPRPHAVAHNEAYRRLIHGYMLRHKVKPGITGWAQVNGWRGETDSIDKMKSRLEHDLEYVRNWSLLLDLKILLTTVATVLSRKNAY
jgi:putative colanic acid biosynthesis UDP-glucose lipid carrier transferase